MNEDVMDFGLSSDQESVRDAVRQIVTANGGLSVAYNYHESGNATTLWQDLATSGFLEAALPTADGESSLLTLVGIWEELGRVAAPVPFLETSAFASGLLPLVQDEEIVARLMSEIGAGDAVTAAAGVTPELRLSAVPAEPLRVRASGRLTAVPYAREARCCLAAGSIDDATGDRLVLVRLSTDGVSVTPMSSADFSLPMYEVTAEDALCELIPVSDFGVARERFLMYLSVAVSLASAAGMEQARDLTSAYVRDRIQFSSPIGAFQAVKHLMADIEVAVRTAKALARSATWSLAQARSSQAVDAAAARSYTAEAFAAVASTGVQLHGAMGYTWEMPINMLLKRSLVWSQYPLSSSDNHKFIYGAVCGGFPSEEK